MTLKKNEATVNRPEGERFLDAAVMMVDIESYISQLLREDAYEKNGKNGITVFKSDGITQVITALQENEEMVENAVDGFVSHHILRGEGTLLTDDTKTSLKENHIVNLHPHLMHTIRANADMVVLTTVTRRLLV